MQQTLIVKPRKLPSKLDDMASKADEAAELLSAMANPVRLLVLCSLVNSEKSVNELVVSSGVSQSTMSQHLAKMRNLKLVATRRDAQNIYYSLASDEVKQIIDTLYGIFCKGSKNAKRD